MSDAYLAAEQALIAQHAKQSDIIISTALIPGKPAPQLITSGAVVSMAHGSVIVDMAAEQGGNCALTERDKVVEKFGVTIIGLTDLPSRMARQSSELYATTVFNLLKEIAPEGDCRDQGRRRGPARRPRAQGRRADVAAAEAAAAARGRSDRRAQDLDAKTSHPTPAAVERRRRHAAWARWRRSRWARRRSSGRRRCSST